MLISPLYAPGARRLAKKNPSGSIKDTQENRKRYGVSDRVVNTLKQMQRGEQIGSLEINRLGEFTKAAYYLGKILQGEFHILPVRYPPDPDNKYKVVYNSRKFKNVVRAGTLKGFLITRM